MMLVIFYFSAQPSSDLPNFGWADAIFKKGGHMLGYAVLAFLYWRGLAFRPERRWLAWLLTVLYAGTDELHQSFVSGRHPSMWDVMIFDNLGALISLWLSNRLIKQQQPELLHPVGEKTNTNK
jgi:VanZ family protein